MSYVDSEIISRLIIDKLISNVIIDNKLKEIDTHFTNHVKKFIFKFIKPSIKSDFIFHEKGLDKIEENVIHFKEQKITKINTWITIPEPETCEPDRFSLKNKLVKEKMQKNDKNNILMNNSVKELELEYITKSSNIMRKSKQKRNYYRNKILKRNILTKKENIDSNDNKKSKVKKKEPILEIEGTYIPLDNKEKINILLNDTYENTHLRKEWELYLIGKQKKEMQEQLRKKLAKAKLLKNKEFKLINTNELTFDSDGNILKLNKLKENSFQNDFISSKSSLKKNKIEEYTPVQTTSQIVNNKINNERSKNSVDNIKLTKLNLEDINNNEIVEYNIEKKMRYKSEFDIYNILNKRNKLKNNTEKLIVSGSNFDKMNPEIGVIISNPENEKDKKIGGFNYIKKYNRPSMNELNEYLSNYNSDMNSNYNNSNSQIASFLYSYSNKNNTNNNNNYNYIGYKEHFNDERNPLFQNAVHINEEKSRNLLNKRDLFNKKSLSNENIFRRNNLLKKGRNKSNNSLFSQPNLITNNNYLSSVNNILLSNKFSYSNLKSFFYDYNENHEIKDRNNINNKKLGNVKVIKENTNNLIFSLKDIRKNKQNILPNINSNKNKNIMGQDYINKFLINTIQKRNLSYKNIENLNDINKENSYKNQFLKSKKYSDSNINKV